MRRGPDLAIVTGWIAVAATLILVPLSLWLTVTGPADPGNPLVDRVLFRLSPLTFGPVGLLIATRRRGNPIAWILIALGLAVTASAVAGDAANADAGPLATGLLALANDVGFLVLVALVSALVLVYPTGRLPSRRWRPVGAAVAVWFGLTLVSLIFAPSIPHNQGSIPNPIGAPGVLGELAQLFANVALGLLIPLEIAVVAAAIARWRRSTGVERQQLELFVYAASLVVLTLVLSVSGLPGPWGAFTNLAILGLPVAIAIAVLRYRLYDIDVLIERTLVYGALSAVLIAAYVVGVAAFQFLLSPFTAGSPIAVAGSTLAVVALFQPLRRGIQSAVDRRFYRRRYDAERTLDAFAVRLRDEIDLEALRAELLDVVGQTIQPAHASLWLR